MKKIIYGFLATVAVLVMVLVFMFDIAGRNLAQSYAQDLLKTPVKIEQFKSSWIDQSMDIGLITVANPPNFEQENALSIERLFVKVSDESTGDLLVIDEISIRNLVFSLEQHQNKINLLVLLNNLRTPQKTPKKSADAPSDQQQRVIIKKFSTVSTQLQINTKAVKQNLKSPDILLRNIGGTEGMYLDEIGKQLMHTIFKELSQTLRKSGKQKLKDHLKQKLKDKLKTKTKKHLSVDDLKQKINNKVQDLFKKIEFQ